MREDESYFYRREHVTRTEHAAPKEEKQIPTIHVQQPPKKQEEAQQRKEPKKQRGPTKKVGDALLESVYLDMRRNRKHK